MGVFDKKVKEVIKEVKDTVKPVVKEVKPTAPTPASTSWFLSK